MPFVAYGKFAVAHRRLIAFGFLAAFTSSFGQTYYNERQNKATT